jgi:hypothetical protein
MRNLTKTYGVVAAVAFAATAPSAVAAEVSKFVCMTVGQSGAREELGDREGHAISITTVACRLESGPLDGGLLTGGSIWEWDKTNATMASASGVVRKPGATAVYRYTEGKIALTMVDGKVTGFTGSGKGYWPVASGSAASLGGKSFIWTSKSTGAGQFETVLTAD